MPVSSAAWQIRDGSLWGDLCIDPRVFPVRFGGGCGGGFCVLSDRESGDRGGGFGGAYLCGICDGGNLQPDLACGKPADNDPKRI